MMTRRPKLPRRASAVFGIIVWAFAGAAWAGEAPKDRGAPAATATPTAPAPAAIPAPAGDAAARPPTAHTRPTAKKTPEPVDPNGVLQLYTDGYAASYLPVPGFNRVNMPVRDATEGAGSTGGCYIACAAHERKDSIYAPDANTFVVGAVRIMGNYQNGACHPGGLEHPDLAADTRLSELCALAMPKLCDHRRCFAHGDTGTWVPPSQNVATSNFPINRPNNGEESCVLACYSHNNEGALYQVASDTFAVGGFQTGGKWVESVCKPEHVEGDLANDPAFKHKCTELFPKACANDACWVNGDTRGRLGGG